VAWPGLASLATLVTAPARHLLASSPGQAGLQGARALHQGHFLLDTPFSAVP